LAKGVGRRPACAAGTATVASTSPSRSLALAAGASSAMAAAAAAFAASSLSSSGGASPAAEAGLAKSAHRNPAGPRHGSGSADGSGDMIDGARDSPLPSGDASSTTGSAVAAASTAPSPAPAGSQPSGCVREAQETMPILHFRVPGSKSS
jgi:hypothetical protein